MKVYVFYRNAKFYLEIVFFAINIFISNLVKIIS